MKSIIDENWFLDKLGEALEMTYGDDVDFTKMEFLKVKNDVYEFMRKAVQSKYGNHEDFGTLQHITLVMLDENLPRFGVPSKRK